MRGIAVGEVIASKSKTYAVGSHAIGMSGWTELAIIKDKDLQKINIPKNGQLTDALGVLGTPALICHHMQFSRGSCATLTTLLGRYDGSDGVLWPSRRRQSQGR